MAYSSVISLKQTLHRFLHSPLASFIVRSSNRQFFESAYNHAASLQRILTKLNDYRSKNLSTLDEQIREEVHKLEDLLELHELNHFPRQDLDVLTEGIESFCEKADKIAAEIDLSEEDDEEKDDDDGGVQSDETLVADPFDYSEMRYRLTERRRPNDFGVFQITGPPGCGATIAAATVFEDLKNHFDCRAGVRIGPRYDPISVLLAILDQIQAHKFDHSNKHEEIGEFLHTSLKGRRYLIVLDDIRDEETWNFFERYFPVEDNGSAVLFTARKSIHRLRNSLMIYNMDTRSQDVWWYLFHTGIFGEEPCPPELEAAGRKIVRNCRSCGVQVLRVVLHLLKAEKTPEYWNKLAADEDDPIFIVEDEVSEVSKVKAELDSANYAYIDDEEKGLLLELIDFSKSFEDIKMEIFPKMFFPNMLTMSFLGMAGIGKTSLVQEIFEDPSIQSHFDHYLWVPLGPEYEYEEFLVDLLAQLHPNIDKNHIKGDEDLCKRLCAYLCDKKCLIVLDDLWSKKPLHYIKKMLSNIKGATLVTTRLSKVAMLGQRDIVFKMRLLNKEESWDLFCEYLFGEERCPLHLEKAGKKIVENCEGLPLMIATVAGLLSDEERTPECWNEEAHQNSRIFIAARDQISKVLSPSYDYLPQFLKVCFLYIGIFPQNKVIKTSKIIIFWIAEGFLEPNQGQTIEDYAAECLQQLDNRSLVMVKEKASNFKIKTFSLHCVFWHLSNYAAMENAFFGTLTTLVDSTTKDIESQRRLCIRNNTLLGIKDVQDSIASISRTRSFLCTGPSHQYPVPVYFGLRLIRLLDALAIRLYEFPDEVVKSYYLRYLALTYNGNLPSSVSKMSNLQFLIVGRHLRIKSSTESSDLPIEIWDMEELKHLQIGGSSLPTPNHGVVRQNLLTLLDVSASSCTKKVLKRLPNLKRLGIQIELEPDEKGNPFRSLNRISRLNGLKSLKCVVVNPEFVSDIVAPPEPRTMFPWGLQKLSLSGLGYPWHYMRIIGKLQNLEVLKLRCYAFRGPVWEMDDDDLLSLRFLLIEDADLVRWNFSMASFVRLKSLCMKHCYELEDLPPDLPTPVESLEVVDCNPFVEEWAKEFEEHVLEFKTVSSWNARN